MSPQKARFLISLRLFISAVTAGGEDESAICWRRGEARWFRAARAAFLGLGVDPLEDVRILVDLEVEALREHGGGKAAGFSVAGDKLGEGEALGLDGREEAHGDPETPQGRGQNNHFNYA